MPIRPFLDGQSFDPETTRVMGVAFETARIALRLTGDNLAEARIAERIVELAKAGERNSDLLCERVLYEFGKPGPYFHVTGPASITSSILQLASRTVDLYPWRGRASTRTRRPWRPGKSSTAAFVSSSTIRVRPIPFAEALCAAL